MRHDGIVAREVSEGRAGLDIVALTQVEVAEGLTSARQRAALCHQFGSLLQIPITQAQQAEIHLALGVGLMLEGLLEPVFGGGEVLALEADRTDVIVGAVVLGVLLDGHLVDVLLLHEVAGEGRGVEQLLEGEGGGELGQQLLDLLVALAEDLDIGDQTRAAQLGQHLVGELAEDGRDVADLALALLGIRVHAQYAQYQILVLEVALLD